MRLPLATWFVFLAAAVAPAAAPAVPLLSPSTEVIAAHRAILRVRSEDRRFVQFFSLYHMTTEERAEFLKVFAVHVNRLSRKPNLRKPLLVTPTLLLVDRRDYGWLRAVVNRLADVDPHFHARVKIDGRQVTVNAPWVDPVLIASLVELTGIDVPILRADWFFRQTVISKGRVAGYYAFLRLKNRADFQRLVGFDKRLAQGSFREVATIVQSGKDGRVAQRNRQIFRFGDGYWETRDQLEKETDEGNAINQLDADYVHQAEEIFAPLPNDLFGYYLSAANGTQQDTAPDEVGPDSTSTSRDGKIHPCLSCVRCHVEGLRPIRDYGRRLFRGRRRLVTLEGKEKLLRLEQLYLKDFERRRKADNLRYREALAEINGEKWTPLEDAEAVRDQWKRWNDDPGSAEQFARELGTTEKRFVEALVRFGTPLEEGGLGQILPNTLLAFVPVEGEKPLKMTREQADEAFGLAFLISRGIVPGLEEKKVKVRR